MHAVCLTVVPLIAILHLMTWDFHGGDYEDDLRPDDAGSTYLWNVGKLVPVYTALQPRRQPSLFYTSRILPLNILYLSVLWWHFKITLATNLVQPEHGRVQFIFFLLNCQLTICLEHCLCTYRCVCRPYDCPLASAADVEMPDTETF
jgi:hypothetical protein